MTPRIHDTTRCLLGEGPLWHPERGQLLWCDILSRRVLTREGDRLRAYDFDRFVSALAPVDATSVLVATATDLVHLNLDSGAVAPVADLPSDRPGLRANDGRADPHGGFWISTMAIDKAPGQGALFRFHGGRVTRLTGDITIPNAICFASDGSAAYFTDTTKAVIHRWALDEAGWPQGDPAPFLDLASQGLNPDGAVTDADGNLWIALWGGGRIAVYAPDASHLRDVALPASQITCPAFGGPDLTTLFATSAAIGLDEPSLTAAPGHGQTFAVPGAGQGRPEPAVIL